MIFSVSAVEFRHQRQLPAQTQTTMPCVKAAANYAANDVYASLRPVNRLTQVAIPQQRARKRAVQAKSQTERGNLSSDQAQKALQYQVERSASDQAPEAIQQPPEGYEQDLKRRQTKAREWITPWLVSAFVDKKCSLSHLTLCCVWQTTKARNRSMDTLATLRESTAGLTAEQQDTALKRLLGQSWQVRPLIPHVSTITTGSLDRQSPVLSAQLSSQRTFR